MQQPLRLIADIGGTNARFALCDDQLRVSDDRQVRCADFPGIESAITYYLQSVNAIDRITETALAIAAPLSGDLVSMTNHHWRFGVTALRQHMKWRRLIVLNDFTALAMAVRHLPKNELQQIGGVQQQTTAPIALLGPGTGLGVSGLIFSGEHWLPLQGEGGHGSLAPGTERELALLRYLWRRFAHVSAERALSGPGLVNLYDAVCGVDGSEAQSYQAQDITERALTGSCLQCVEALDTFCALLGSVAGNLVLTLGATSAVYIGGGIVPRLGDYFMRSKFRERFESKGRYVEYLRPVPAYVIHSAQPAFVGLAQSFVSPGPRVEAVG
jgi:glucokinase